VALSGDHNDRGLQRCDRFQLSDASLDRPFVILRLPREQVDLGGRVAHEGRRMLRLRFIPHDINRGRRRLITWFHFII
jgi:hypothetical protein